MAAQNLLDEPVGGTLWRLSLPMAVGVVAMFLVSLIDTYWASRLGTDALAAMSFAFPVIGIVINVSLGLMIGTSVAIARSVGGGDEVAARRLASHAMLLGLVIVVGVSAIGLVTQDFVFLALGAPHELLPTIDAYMRIWYLSAIFLVVPMILNGVLRAHGDAITARNTMILSAIFNGILDPIFIFGFGPIPALGLEGAAIATAISRALTFLYAMAVAIQMKTLTFHVPPPAQLWRSWRTILQVGVPATLTNVLGPIATAVLTAIVATHGSAAVAAYGIGARVESILLIPAMALGSGLSPFVGQNWAAHLRDRVARAFSLSVRFSLGWGAFALVLMLITAPWVADAFTDEAEVRADIVLYLRIVPLGYGAYSVMMMVSSAFNAVDHATRASVLSALRSLVFAVPLAWLGSAWFGLSGVFAALAISSAIAAAIGGWWMRAFLRADEGERVDAPAKTNDAAFLIDNTVEAHRPVIQELIDAMLALERVELHKTRGNAVGFFVGNRELGHIHPSGHLDLPLPLEVGEYLVGIDVLTHHRMAESGWYSHDLKYEDDSRSARRLLLLAHVLFELSTRGPNDPVTRGELDALEIDPKFEPHLERAASRWRPAA